jgi:hypothetical protein
MVFLRTVLNNFSKRILSASVKYIDWSAVRSRIRFKIPEQDPAGSLNPTESLM